MRNNYSSLRCGHFDVCSVKYISANGHISINRTEFWRRSSGISSTLTRRHVVKKTLRRSLKYTTWEQRQLTFSWSEQSYTLCLLFAPSFFWPSGIYHIILRFNCRSVDNSISLRSVEPACELRVRCSFVHSFMAIILLKSIVRVLTSGSTNAHHLSSVSANHIQ
jgi:hypothetical protein